MLVLTRKPGEAFGIGDNIVVRVLSIRQGTVRIGVEAPPEIPVVRDDAKDKRPRKEPDHA
jgi:carbon storage regulator